MVSPRPDLSVNPESTPNRPRSPYVNTPQSAIIAVPSSWGLDEMGRGSSGGQSRTSMDSQVSRNDIDGLPRSASASSSTSQPIFSWPQPIASSSRTPSSHLHDDRDPFDTTKTFSEDPFANPSESSSNSDEDRVQVPYVDEVRRGSVVMLPQQFRSTTDPLLHDQPVDSEFTAGLHGDGYDFESPTLPHPPSFNRTISAPLPIRVGSLRHPLSPTMDPLGSHSAHPPSRFSSFSSILPEPATARPGMYTIKSDDSEQLTQASSTTASSEVVTPLQSLSLELADSLQSAIQTLLHLSPPHLLDNAKEQYSGCTVQMPTTSLSALLTSMRGLNYLSANVEHLCAVEAKKDDGLLAGARKEGQDFDIGELLQSVADLLGGQAAQAGVDFVLFHGDVGIKHVSVNGDGEGLGYVLSHVIRQILLVANKGDTIELGLQIIPQTPSMTPRVALPLTASVVEDHERRTLERVRSSSPGRTLASPSDSTEGPLLCIFEIVHNVHQTLDTAVTPKAELNPFTRLAEQHDAELPKLDSLLCRRLLQQQNASLKQDTQPSSPLNNGMPRRAYELSVLLARGTPFEEPPKLSVEEEAVRQPFAALRLAREPTLPELSEFAESLRGKKVLLHANLSSVFARHLTSYLGAWGLDISHIPIEDHGEVPLDRSLGVSRDPSQDITTGVASMNINNNRDTEKFIIIDDDVAILRRELMRIRVELNSLSLRPRLNKRPTMIGRTRSSPHVRQISGSSSGKPAGPVLIHFTSLAKYNQVRDVVSNLLGPPFSAGGGAFGHTEVMVIPKPVGPRRFLTALHTAVNQPVVDPFFSPIATSPRSPGGGYFAFARTPLGNELPREGFFDAVVEEGPELTQTRRESNGSQKAKSPLGEFPPSAAQIIRTEGGMHLSLPTPGDILATPASEYFSNATTRPSSGASGVVMQSPDGRPFGMFFEPPIKNERRGSYTQRVPSDSIRRRSTRKVSGAGVDESASPTISPNTSRRISNVPGPLEGDRRGSGTNAEVSGLPQSTSQGSIRGQGARRKTLPDNPEPIMAVGRDRAATVSRGSRRNTPGNSPIVASSPKNKEEGNKETRRNSVIKAKADAPVVPPINVLIVEDNPINQNILSMFLRKKKIKHQSAKDGLEAVEKWRTGGFHLILMDIQLPVMDGIEATKEIRKLEQHNNIGVFPSTPISENPKPVNSYTGDTNAVPASPFRSSVIIVALTASSMQSDRVAALAAGCNDFLTKPVSLKWLEKKIIEWGCMQALIDFDGWRRWKSSDPKDAGETKRGFQVGPQAAARNLATRLRIERKPSARSPIPTVREPLPSTTSVNPEINVQAATPVPLAVDDPVAAESLQQAREELVDDQRSAVGAVPDGMELPGPASGLGKGASVELKSLGSGEGSGEGSGFRTLDAIREDAESPLVKSMMLPGGVDKPLPELPRE